MNLDYLIPLYYSDEWEIFQNDGINNAINNCYSEALPYVPKDIKSAIETNHFHDWSLSSLSVYYKNGICVDLTLSYNDTIQTVAFSNVTSFEVKGSITIDALNFPVRTETAIAQVMDIWITYKNDLEYIVLLNDCRYLKITTSIIS